MMDREKSRVDEKSRMDRERLKGEITRALVSCSMPDGVWLSLSVMTRTELLVKYERLAEDVLLRARVNKGE